MEPGTARADVVVIGGGQAGLAAGYYLRRAGLPFVILDAGVGPGGAWRYGWDSLHLFSPALYSPLPGWRMPEEPGERFPSAGHVRQYLTAYETRYDLPVERPVAVTAVHATDSGLTVSSAGREWREWHARAVISATGTWGCPYRPRYPGHDLFQGRQLHTVSYRRPDEFAGQHVVVVGGGNSAAQILAEVSVVARTTWVTPRPPRFLPDDVDGRVLFDVAARRTLALRQGRSDDGGRGRARRHRDGAARAGRPRPRRPARRTDVLPTRPGRDRVVRRHRAGVRRDHLVHRVPPGPGAPGSARTHQGRRGSRTNGTRSVDEPRLHLLGYGDWTGAASATIIGATRTSRDCVAALVRQLQNTV